VLLKGDTSPNGVCIVCFLDHGHSAENLSWHGSLGSGVVKAVSFCQAIFESHREALAFVMLLDG
jgi:hypothetical protein